MFFKLYLAAAKSLQLYPTLCNPIDGSPPGSAIPVILSARTLEWIAISFSSAWKWKVKVKSFSRVGLLATPWTAAHQAPPPMGFSRQDYCSGVPYMCSKWRIEFVLQYFGTLTIRKRSVHVNFDMIYFENCGWKGIVFPRQECASVIRVN